MDELLEVLDELGKLDLTESEVENLLCKLREIYTGGFRHSYAEISSFLDNVDNETLDNIHFNVSKLFTRACEQREEGDDYRDLTKSLGKLEDHVHLEVIHIHRTRNIQFIGKQASQLRNEALEYHEQVKNEIQGIQDRVDGFHGQSVTILGIFAGLVMGFSAITDLVTGSVTKTADVSFWSLAQFLFLLTPLVADLIFLLMYCISKINHSSLAVMCRNRDCTSCEGCGKKPIFLRRLHKKYPYIYWINVWCALILIAFELLPKACEALKQIPFVNCILSIF